MNENIIQDLLSTSGAELFDQFRITRSALYMSMARLVSYRGTCNRGGRAGAVIEKDGRIVSMGYAGSPPKQPHCIADKSILEPGVEKSVFKKGHKIFDNHIIDDSTGGCIRTLHAEANAIAWAAKMGIPVNGATMYCTLQPCLSCAKIIATAGIRMLIYYDTYRDHRGIELLDKSGMLVYHYKKMIQTD